MRNRAGIQRIVVVNLVFISLFSMHSFAKDFYGILGVSPSATQAEIKNAHMQKVKALHPDANVNLSENERQKKSIELAEVNAAAKILRNENDRRAYDLTVKFEKENSQSYATNTNNEFIPTIGIKTLQEVAAAKSQLNGNELLNFLLDVARKKLKEEGIFQGEKSAQKLIKEYLSLGDIWKFANHPNFFGGYNHAKDFYSEFASVVASFEALGLLAHEVPVLYNRFFDSGLKIYRHKVDTTGGQVGNMYVDLFRYLEKIRIDTRSVYLKLPTSVFATKACDSAIVVL